MKIRSAFYDVVRISFLINNFRHCYFAGRSQKIKIE